MSTNDFYHEPRPLSGFDIEDWRSKHGLSLDDAAYALGLASLKKKASSPLPIDYSLELLMRLYDEDPSHGVWPKNRITLRDLFDQLYGAALEPFKGGSHDVTARVDLQSRFAKLMGRSKGRAYRWLDEKGTSVGNHTQESIQAVLGKLSQVKNPAATLERLGALIWALRGEDIDSLYPIPTSRHPPRRERRGRRPGSRILAEGNVRRVVAPTIALKLKDVSLLSKTAPLKKSSTKTAKPVKAEEIDVVKKAFLKSSVKGAKVHG